MVTTGFRKCQKSDFEKNGYDTNFHQEINISQRYCPDITSKFMEHYKIQGMYSDQESRRSFQIEIVAACTATGKNGISEDQECPLRSNTAHILKDILFTLYHLNEKIELGNINNIGKKPVRVIDSYHS